MKKVFLLLILCLPAILSHAQQTDKKLLYGRWDLYSLRDVNENLYRDSMAEYIKAEMNYSYKLGIRMATH